MELFLWANGKMTSDAGKGYKYGRIIHCKIDLIRYDKNLLKINNPIFRFNN